MSGIDLFGKKPGLVTPDDYRNSDKLEPVYEGLLVNYRNWLAFQQRYPEAVEVRIAPVPVLRNYTCFSFAEPEKGSMRVVFYTYGNFFFGQYYSVFPPCGSAPYELFRIEFEHLWEHSRPIEAHLAEIDSAAASDT